MRKKYWIIIFICLVFLATYLFFSKKVIAPVLPTDNFVNQIVNSEAINVSASTTQSELKQVISLPIDNALERITKKPFGIKISPQDSPVMPEKFSGYHTGVDFEVLLAEASSEIAIKAICDGKLLLKRQASGYGGVLVQSCQLNGRAATVVYGHLSLASVNLAIGDNIKAGQIIALLGKGFSTETDGERKHLHLSIHLGSEINIRGYVEEIEQLQDWLDPMSLLKNN